MYSDYGFVDKPNLHYPDQNHLGDFFYENRSPFSHFLMGSQPFKSNQASSDEGTYSAPTMPHSVN